MDRVICSPRGRSWPPVGTFANLHVCLRMVLGVSISSCLGWDWFFGCRSCHCVCCDGFFRFGVGICVCFGLGYKGFFVAKFWWAITPPAGKHVCFFCLLSIRLFHCAWHSFKVKGFRSSRVSQQWRLRRGIRELVFCYDFKKMKPKWEGPFIITDVLSPVMQCYCNPTRKTKPTDLTSLNHHQSYSEEKKSKKSKPS